MLKGSRRNNHHHDLRGAMNSIKTIEVDGKRVFVRVDFNVPMDESQNITDDSRIRGVLPTLEYLLEKNARLIIASHMGRPKGEVVPELSLSPVAKRLGSLIEKDVRMADDCIGSAVKALISEMAPGEIVLLENLRFHPEEAQNDDAFAKELASLCDVYVNDAFAVSHRANASVAAITKYAPKSAAGFLLQKELDYFQKALAEPRRPLVAVIGGAKVSSKLGALENMLNHVDKFIIGGAMANTFLKSTGCHVGKSMVEDDLIEVADSIMKQSADKGINFYLPVDAVVAREIDPKASIKIVPVKEIPPDWMALDIGPATSLLYSEVLYDAKTIIWNGPMGIFEIDAFSKGTEQIANFITSLNGVISIIGGGDTAAAVAKFKLEDKMTHISTGGGASLEYLEGRVLPGIAALEDK